MSIVTLFTANFRTLQPNALDCIITNNTRYIFVVWILVHLLRKVYITS
jgi:hypothetical protein